MQMLNKISVASIVRSDFYLVLDQDVVATRHTAFADLVVNGSAVYAAKPFDYPRHRLAWWDAADTILKARGCVTVPRERVIGVTPAILSTRVSRLLMAQVGALHGGRPWDQSLFRLRLDQNLDWSEYTLYWTCACSFGLTAQLHTSSGLDLYEESAFEYGAWQEWSAERAFGDDSFIFTVIQSIGGAPAEWVVEQVEPFLSRPHPVTQLHEVANQTQL